MVAAVLALTAISKVYSSRKNRKALREQAAREEYNAMLAEKAAQVEAARVEEEGARFQSRNRVVFAKSGVTLSGTVKHVQKDNQRQIDLDVAQIRENGVIAANARRWQAAQYRQAGNEAIRQGAISVVGSYAGSYMAKLYDKD